MYFLFVFIINEQDVTSICSCKRINTTTCGGDVAINRDYEIHSIIILA